ncbi:MAG: hypothetical protein O2867_04985 [Bacteroidetes bacterium]|jgi:hypothetical protein|nr:hypothetical protein [Bacteroidota bacterium]
MNLIKSILFSSAFVLLAPFSSTAQVAPELPASFYRSSIINTILNNEGCFGIRVYPALNAKANTLTTMIIGIDKDGKELASDFASKYTYQMFKGVLNGKAAYDPLNSTNARWTCSGYSLGNYPKFVAEFQKSALMDMINGNDGIRLVNTYSESRNNFKASGAKLGGNDFDPSTAAAEGEPCPAMCGNPSDYVSPVN